MFLKLKLFLALFRQGEEVADPKLWKERQNAANKIGALLGTAVLLAKAFGVEVPFSTEELAALALVLAAVGNWVFTLITSKKVGLPAQQLEESMSGSQPSTAGPVQVQPQADPDEDLYRR